jgi:hypothetical protein
MFKESQTTKSKPAIEVKVIIAWVNIVDVNVTTQSKGSEKQVFKDWKLRKNKSAANWEVKERVERSMVETVQHM